MVYSQKAGDVGTYLPLFLIDFELLRTLGLVLNRYISTYLLDVANCLLFNSVAIPRSDPPVNTWQGGIN